MNKKNEVKIPVSLKRLEARFAGWRKDKRGRERIPEELWTAAERIARRDGVNLVSKVLSLSYAELKRRISKDVTNRTGRQPPDAMFVEMEGITPGRDSSCVIELEKENGIRMKISVKDGSTVDWGRIKEAFLGA